MSGKFIAAVVAAAVSSASAATVGVVYTRIVGSHHVEASAPTRGAAPGPGPVKSAVVLNASEGLFQSFSGHGAEGDAPACANIGDPQHCGAGEHGSDVRLNILGSSLTILPIWLGRDSEDQYANRANTSPLSTYVTAEPVEVVAPLSHRHDGDPGDQTGSESHGGSQGQGGSKSQKPPLASHASTRLTTHGVGVQGVDRESRSPPPLEPDAVSELLLVINDPSDLDPLSKYSPIDARPSVRPMIGYSVDVGPSPLSAPDLFAPGLSTRYVARAVGGGGTAPEPSAWVMMIAGFASLCVLKRRRIAAALKSAGI